MTANSELCLVFDCKGKKQILAFKAFDRTEELVLQVLFLHQLTKSKNQVNLFVHQVDFKTEVHMGALHSAPNEIDQEYEKEIIKKATEL